MAEHIGTVLTRVLANCRVRMDKRKRKAGAGRDASAGSEPRGMGGTNLAGKERAALRGAPGSEQPRRAERRPTAALSGSRLEAAE